MWMRKTQVQIPSLWFLAQSFFEAQSPLVWGFSGGSDSQESACIVRDLGREDSPGGGHGNPLQYSCLENPHGQRSLEG